MDPLTIAALVGGGSSLIGGLLNSSSQSAINSANIGQSQYMALNSVRDRVEDARQAGISPLAALGVSGVQPAVQVGTQPGAGFSELGQNLSRASTATSDTDQKLSDLNAQLVQAKIDNTQADTAHQQLLNSQIVTANAPGTPNAPSVPLPREDPRFTSDIKPATQRFLMPDGTTIRAPSQALTQSEFSLDPLGIPRALSIDTSDIQHVRPDVSRFIQNYQLPTPAAGDYSTP